MWSLHASAPVLAGGHHLFPKTISPVSGRHDYRCELLSKAIRPFSPRGWCRLWPGVALVRRWFELVLCQPCSDAFKGDLLPRGMVGGGGGEAVPGDVDGGGA
jgi:hypothetical protein